jgi:hypothetical protein
MGLCKIISPDSIKTMCFDVAGVFYYFICYFSGVFYPFMNLKSISSIAKYSVKQNNEKADMVRLRKPNRLFQKSLFTETSLSLHVIPWNVLRETLFSIADVSGNIYYKKTIHADTWHQLEPTKISLIKKKFRRK